jgi:hypothetical protein
VRDRNTRLTLFTPSPISAFFVFLTVMYYLSKTFWSRYINFPLDQNYVISLNYIREYTEKGISILDIVNRSVLSTNFMNTLLLFVFWLVIGVVLYFIVTTAYFWLKDTRSVVTEKSFVNRHKIKIMRTKQLIDRALIRLAVILIWLFYIVIYIQIIVPASLLCVQIAIELGWVPNFAYAVFGVFLLVVSTHLHVVLCRLSFLRIRLFGGSDFAK